MQFSGLTEHDYLLRKHINFAHSPDEILMRERILPGLKPMHGKATFTIFRVFFLRNFCCSKKKLSSSPRHCVTIHNKLFSLTVICINPTSNPLSGSLCLLIQYTSSYTPYLEALSNIRRLRTRHVLVTRDPLNQPRTNLVENEDGDFHAGSHTIVNRCRNYGKVAEYERQPYLSK
jgi:hypothetical protein